MDEVVENAFEVLFSGTADACERVAAAEVVKAWSDAEQMRALRDVAKEQPEFLDPTGRPVDPGVAEVAAMLAWTTGAADQKMGLAITLCEELPGVLEALERGDLDFAKAREIALGTCGLDVQDRIDVADGACDYARGRTRGQVRAWLARRIAALHPETAEKRRRKAVKARRVWMHPESDGMAIVSAYLTAEEARGVIESISAAAANIEGGVDGPGRTPSWRCSRASRPGPRCRSPS